MARAKTTDRADARRRYRAQLAEQAAAEAEATASGFDEPAQGGGKPAASRANGRAQNARTQNARTQAGAPAGTQPRLGVVELFRRASSPADVRADIRAFPEIARRSPALWLSLVLVVVGAIAYLIPSIRPTTVGALAWSMLLVPPTFVPAFLAGFFMRRGAWLGGGIAGLFQVIVLAIVILLTPGVSVTSADASTGSTTASPSASAVASPVTSVAAGGSTSERTTGTGVTGSFGLNAVVYYLFGGPVFGAGVGAGAGFYRRFLTLSNPGRTQPQRRKPAPRRR